MNKNSSAASAQPLDENTLEAEIRPFVEDIEDEVVSHRKHYCDFSVRVYIL